jgi:hypothetical protein
LSPSAWAVDADHDNAREPYGKLWLDAYTELARLYDVTVVGVSNVGRLTGGPWAGRKCISGVLVLDNQAAVIRRLALMVPIETVRSDAGVILRRDPASSR